jgi:hypothetical protein
MKASRILLVSLAILAIGAFAPLMIAHAAAPVQVTPPADVGAFLQAVLALLTSMVGFPAFVGTALALLTKLFPTIFTDTLSKWVSFGANILMFGVIGYLMLAGQLGWVTTIDTAFGGLNKLLLDILIVVGGFGISLATTPKYAFAVANHGAGFRAMRQLYLSK